MRPSPPFFPGKWITSGRPPSGSAVGPIRDRAGTGPRLAGGCSISRLLLALTVGIAVLVGVASPGIAQSAGVEQVKAGKVYFEQNCAICHAARLGPDNVEIVQQGPSLVGVLGRRAGTGTKFNFTQALRNSGLVWDTATLDRFLADPAAAVPGTIMPMAVAKPEDRGAVIAYLVTLKPPGNGSATAPPRSGSAPPSDSDWQRAAPGVKHHLTVADLPAPFSSRSVGNGPQVVKRPDNAQVSVPPGFTARLFATGLSNPRLLRVAPNRRYLHCGDRPQPPSGAAGRRRRGSADGESNFRRGPGAAVRHGVLSAGR